MDNERRNGKKIQDMAYEQLLKAGIEAIAEHRRPNMSGKAKQGYLDTAYDITVRMNNRAVMGEIAGLGVHRIES